MSQGRISVPRPALTAHSNRGAMSVIEIILVILAVYCGLGLIVGGYGLVRVAPRHDSALRGASWSLRLLLLPGAAALWPLVWVRWTTGGRA